MENKNFKGKKADFTDVFGSLKKLTGKKKLMSAQAFKDFVRKGGESKSDRLRNKDRKY